MPSVSFDVIGTCFAFDTPIAKITALLGPTLTTHSISPESLFFVWFYSAQRDFTYLSLSNAYVPIATVLRTTFRRAVLTLGLPATAIPDGAADALMGAFKSLTPHPGLKACVEGLRGRGWNVLAVTNGGAETSQGYFRGAGIEMQDGDVLSCDEIKVAKPDVKVYENARRVLAERAEGKGEGEKGERWFVAAHAWDLVAARKAGFRTAFLDYEEHDPVTEVFGEFDVYASSMEELAEKLLGFGK
jgi:2-haloacid dehalogenase